MYGPVQPHWIGSPQRVDNVLVLGSIIDPAFTGGALVPGDFPQASISEGLQWFSVGGLSQVYAFIQSFTEPDHLWEFGPKRGDPIGVYLFERRPASDPRCREWKVAGALAEKLSFNPLHPPRPSIPPDQCLIYSYVGPLDLRVAPYIYLSYFSNNAFSRGAGVDVYELRRGPTQVVARSVECFTNSRVGNAAGCTGSSDLLSILKP